MKCSIRKATVDDYLFIVNGNCCMAKETENKVLDDTIVKDGVLNILKDNSKGFYLLAQVQEKVVGQLMITYEWSDWRNRTFWWIQSVYILPENRRSGIFSQLYQYVKVAAAKEGDVCGIRLYVEKTNKIAQETYVNLGMNLSHYDFMEEELS